MLLPHSYTGRGPAESCVRILASFPQGPLDTTLFVLRLRKAVHPGLKVVQGAGPILRRLPFRQMHKSASAKLFKKFARAIDQAEPGTIVWFWPGGPSELVQRAKDRGLITVGEMINSPMAHAKSVLDAAYVARGLVPAHGIGDGDVARENEVLALYDRLFASNAEVEAALITWGVSPSRILSTSFGWDRRRFPKGAGQTRDANTPFTACFVGLMNVRKGLPDLLDAWRLSGIKGELVLAGRVEPSLQPMVDAAIGAGNVRHLGQVDDVASLYRNCDVFVFPTLEEGGPQVTYEAAACSLPVITTPMGAARLVRDAETGLLVEAGNVIALAQALKRFAADTALRKRCGEAARSKADEFEYGVVGAARMAQLCGLLRNCEQTD
ncbi:glycosyltransferase [Novosphingobium hassiacum]|uniref:glycosyltransferase n=1 Tax=Novosphingobium hassiacum TaxID=173676 RepID=UPI001616FA29